MLIGRGVFQNGTGMQPGLMRKGRGPDIGCRAQRHPVQNIIQHPADAHHSRQSLMADTGFKPAGIGLFQQQRRDQTGQIRIATALAQSVHRALHLPRPGHQRRPEYWPPHCRYHHGNGCPDDPPECPRQSPRRVIRPTSAGKVPPLVSQSTTHRAPASKAARKTAQRIVRVGTIAIKEMLGIKQAPRGPWPPDAQCWRGSPRRFSSSVTPNAVVT